MAKRKDAEKLSSEISDRLYALHAHGNPNFAEGEGNYLIILVIAEETNDIRRLVQGTFTTCGLDGPFRIVQCDHGDLQEVLADGTVNRANIGLALITPSDADNNVNIVDRLRDEEELARTAPVMFIDYRHVRFRGYTDLLRSKRIDGAFPNDVQVSEDSGIGTKLLSALRTSIQRRVEYFAAQEA